MSSDALSPKVKKTNRRMEREIAFQVLYSVGFSTSATEQTLKQAYETLPDLADKESTPQHTGFAWDIIHGVWNKQAEIDASLKKYSQHWRVERIGRVELTILRMAFFELFFRQDIPLKVSINEAIELAKSFGDDTASSFINGILDATAKAIENGTEKRQ